MEELYPSFINISGQALSHASADSRRRKIGVPQGGPLSPLCGNILLNELDWELERRGHRFVRYGDDMLIFTQKQEGGRKNTGKSNPVHREKIISQSEQGKDSSSLCRQGQILRLRVLHQQEQRRGSYVYTPKVLRK